MHDITNRLADTLDRVAAIAASRPRPGQLDAIRDLIERARREHRDAASASATTTDPAAGYATGGQLPPTPAQLPPDLL